MNGLGVLNVIAALLQLIVPSYALRLVRRFGAQRVGWFVVASFASLAMLHLLQPATRLLQPGSGWMHNVAFALASGLLLIGMSHLDTLLSQRTRLKQEEEQLQATL